MQQPAGELVLTGPGHAVEGRTDQGMGAALDQGQEPQLRAAALNPAERRGVGRGTGRVYPGPVPGHQPQPERERTRRPRLRQRPAAQAEQQLKRPGSQPLPRSGQRRAGRQARAAAVPYPVREPAHHRPVPRRSHAVRAAEQAQPQHEIHHRPRRQQPPPLLTAPSPVDHLVHQARADLPGQHPEPGRAWQAGPAIAGWRPQALGGGKRQHGHGTLSAQRSTSTGRSDLGRPQSYRGLRCIQATAHRATSNRDIRPVMAVPAPPHAPAISANALTHRHCFGLGG